ncbi:hypothetical protein CHU92_02930 [Flavobacterium cyanobacteriorum]|uniref:Lipoprotein n=1 Tax=Flavobacterium cyanobacteriorum TaxID=2022802 RepID=A0A255ZQN2_9FLAO|nr:hypothetical protein [Flavobacterium cyanobacteriorum]OYQ43818.1 hypothetical protein CHU92_02930 [Flavobacterium cyanobacteriorum]
MKKLFLLAALPLLLLSCDFMFKERKDKQHEANAENRVVLGTDSDEKGCVASAGYRWSVLRKECIRLFEEGYRLNKINTLKEGTDAESAFIIFDENGERAELFLPDAGSKSVILRRENKNSPYTGDGWALLKNKGFSLSRNRQLLFAAAAIEESRIIGTDQPEEQ